MALVSWGFGRGDVVRLRGGGVVGGAWAVIPQRRKEPAACSVRGGTGRLAEGLAGKLGHAGGPGRGATGARGGRRRCAAAAERRGASARL